MKTTQLLLLLLFTSMSLFASELTMKVAGDSINGYSVNLFYGKTPVASSHQLGELSLYAENEDHSIGETVSNWKATSVLQSGQTITLTGTVQLSSLETDLFLTVTYEIINQQVVEKRIELLQTTIPLLFYAVSTALQATVPPSRFWSFDDADHQGGVAHETFPAAGYMIGDTLAVGLLTDAGNRNLWTRNIRRRPSNGEIGFRAIREIGDAHLYRLASADDRKEGLNAVKLTFGELSDFNHPLELIAYETPVRTSWKPYNGANVTQNETGFVLQGDKASTDRAGVRLPYPTVFTPFVSAIVPTIRCR